MEFFIKKLKSNESGYSGKKQNSDNRGPFLIIPKNCYEFFPEHSTKYRNDVALVSLTTPKGNNITRRYVWHNTKHFLNTRPDLKRGHDEKRLYRSQLLTKDLDLDKDVFFICCKKNGSERDYFSFSVDKLNKNYDYLNKKYIKGQIVEDKVVEDIFEAKFKSYTSQDEKTIIEEDIMKEFSDEQPCTAKEAKYLTDTQFRTFVMNAYGSKCCIKEDSIVYGDKIMLEAAHIKPKRSPHNGPNIPSNGLALSHDLHRMFDEGMWTITEELKVLVHPKLLGQNLLGMYHDKAISPPLIPGSFFNPDPQYLKFHRDSEFGKFDKTK